MTTSPAEDPILRRFRTALDALYGNRIERVVLFGSRARGDALEDSDYDVAVFLKDLADRMPHRAGAYDDRTRLMREIRREGIDL
jgi:predicted nucleotidyltransferase